MATTVATDPDVILRAESIGVTYGRGADAVEAIGDITFAIGRGEFVCVVGPSGCGKTTLLRALSGLLDPSRGDAYVDDVRVAGPAKGLAMVFQEYTRSLMPWLTVARNITFPLKAQGLPKEEIAARLQEALHQVGLDGFAEKYPWQLSGGMQQRVAIARAIAYRPAVLLMDEPFASVDAQTRADLEDLLLRIRRETGVTVLFVTHDIDESVYLGDRVIVLSHRPTTVKVSLDVPLPPERDQLTTKSLPEFIELRKQVMELIREEQRTR